MGGDRPRMSLDVARRLVGALDAGLTDVEAVCLHLYGGEPLTHLDALEAMLDEAECFAPGRFQFAITTNGTVVSDRAISLLHRGRFEVILSIDGPPEVHDECRRTDRGGLTHHTVMSFLAKIRASGDLWVRGSSVVRRGWSLREASEYLRTLPVDVIKAQAVRGPPESPFALGEREMAAYLEDLEWTGRTVIAELEEGLRPKDDRFNSRVLQLLARRTRDRFCGVGETNLGISPDGRVLPCILLPSENGGLGHILDDPPDWAHAGRRWRKEQIRRPECDDCSAFTLCGGGCPVMTGLCGATECDIIRKNCEVARAIYEHFESCPETLLLLAGID